ncbi:MAG: hypothetical protein AB1810_12195 [Pseudomonadota bacterium]
MTLVSEGYCYKYYKKQNDMNDAIGLPWGRNRPLYHSKNIAYEKIGMVAAVEVTKCVTWFVGGHFVWRA